MERLSQTTTLKAYGGSHEGMSGKHNEDSYGIFAWKLNDSQIMHLGVVADGVGGQIAGEIASRLTIETVANYFDGPDTINNISGHLEQAILAANEAVYNASQENPEHRGMSTTIAMAAIVDNRLYTAHIGDSRIYLLRDGRLTQISIDHTWAQEAIEAGLLTREQAKTHPNRNVIKRHLGGKLQIEVDHRLALIYGQSAEEAHQNQGMTLNPGDTILICSDGLTDMISDEDALESLKNHFHDLPAATSELIDKANRAGGRDNITVVLLQIPGKEGLPVATTLIEHRPAAEVVEPTLITKAPNTILRGKAAPQPSDTGPVVAQPIPQNGRSWKVPILLLIGGGALLLAVLAAGAYFLFGDMLNPTPTPTTAPTAAIIEETPLPTNTPGSPATAAFLETAASSTESTEDTAGGTAEGVPTLRPTLTPSVTPTRTPIPPPLSTPAPTNTTAGFPTITFPTDEPPAPTNPPPAPATSTQPSAPPPPTDSARTPIPNP